MDLPAVHLLCLEQADHSFEEHLEQLGMGKLGPGEFNSNPDQTHLNKLINVFRITRRLQTGEFYQGWSSTLQDTGPSGPSLPMPDLEDFDRWPQHHHKSTVIWGGSLRSFMESVEWVLPLCGSSLTLGPIGPVDNNARPTHNSVPSQPNLKT
ncbi:hypothetical protein M9458_046963, partial [Cirrhinus mrigala]